MLMKTVRTGLDIGGPASSVQQWLRDELSEQISNWKIVPVNDCFMAVNGVPPCVAERDAIFLSSSVEPFE